jgi:hypothetical protein
MSLCKKYPSGKKTKKLKDKGRVKVREAVMKGMKIERRDFYGQVVEPVSLWRNDGVMLMPMVGLDRMSCLLPGQQMSKINLYLGGG